MPLPATHRSVAAACDELADVGHAPQVWHVLPLQQTLQALLEAGGGNGDGVVAEGDEAWEKGREVRGQGRARILVMRVCRHMKTWDIE